jgi:two-component sensor histidine kinase
MLHESFDVALIPSSAPRRQQPQIIASLLMQSARNVQSEEARLHLHHAPHWVLSFAAVQRHLAPASHGDIALSPYFAHLCDSLAASMIFDPKRLSIVTSVDDSVVKVNVSVNLGLIITELVINALKHAFMEDRHGKITINYRSEGSNWTLSVSDDGIGMPSGADKAKAGLGTGIVEALARHLDFSARKPSRKARCGSSLTRL